MTPFSSEDSESSQKEKGVNQGASGLHERVLGEGEAFPYKTIDAKQEVS